jgi:hypothetical protein
VTLLGALAWLTSVAGAEPVALPAPARSISAEADLILVFSDDVIQAWNLRSGLVVRTWPGPAVGAVRLDLEGDGRDELLTCGAAGVVAHGWDAPRDPIVLLAEPCAAIGLAGGSRVVVSGANGSAAAWDLAAGVPTRSGDAGTPAGPAQAVVVDLDGDGCEEQVSLRADPPALDVVEEACEPPPAPMVAAPAAPRRAYVLGTSFPAFVGPEDDGVGWPRTITTVGFGWVAGSTLGRGTIQLPMFPALALGTEIGSPAARLYLGLDSAGFFLWTWPAANGGLGGGIHLANLTLGGTFGGSDLAMGPFVTAGLINVGAGVRAVWSPFETRNGSSGFEARLTVFRQATGEAMLLYVARSSHSVRSGGGGAREPFCEEFELGVGASAGVSATRDSWEFVGSSAQWRASGSPALAAACETGGAAAWLLGAETAPFYTYITPPEGQRVPHFGSLTVGLSAGGDAVRVGPIATAGIWTAGAGARLRLTPFEDRHGQRHGFDLRALALAPFGPSYEAMVLYGGWLDPRRAEP